MSIILKTLISKANSVSKMRFYKHIVNFYERYCNKLSSMKILKFISALVILKLGISLLTIFANTGNLSSSSFIFHFSEEGQEPQTKTFEIGRLADILDYSRFDANKSTTLYAHGFAEKLEDESMKTIVAAYLARPDFNLIVLNWVEPVAENYLLSAIPNMIKISRHIAKDLLKLFDRGFPVNNLHLVGHSLGGQLVGTVGRDVIRFSRSSVILRRISALDPAFPGFYPGFFFKAINAYDARFVDVIHTDSGMYGAPVRTGTVDFSPNGGTTLQPGCPTRNYQLFSANDLCSHRRSWIFWAESVANKYPAKFNAIKADSWSQFKYGVTSSSDTNVVMGIDCPENIDGKYYLTTNGSPPFAKGEAGTAYEH